MRNDKGFTLTELIVTMAIFIIVMIAISTTFSNIVGRAGQQAKSATNQIEGVVGLEMLRTDVSHAGFGLPWTLGGAAGVFPEVTDSPVPGLTVTVGGSSGNASKFNDSVPRAVTVGTTAGGSHYLVLKSALLSLNTNSTGRFGFVNYSANGKSYIHTVNNPAVDVHPGDRIITILSGFSNTGAQTKQLLMNGTDFYFTLGSGTALTNGFSLAAVDNAYKPASPSQVVLAYAVSDSSALKMPYNRADYYIHRDSNTIPASCNANTGVLYKAVAGQTASPVYAAVYPLLNCVGDMQVIFGLDHPSGSGTVANYAPESPVVSALSASDLARELKEVRVYVLAHEGGKDVNYRYPASSVVVGEFGLGRTVDLEAAFGPDWMNYRWKVYSFSVQMKNLGGA